MVNYREILRLSSLNYSMRQIASSLSCARETISEVRKLAEKNNLVWPLSEDISNHDIQDLFYPERKVGHHRIPDYEHMHRELARPGVTLTLLWAEYTVQCLAENEVPYQLTQFCENYRKWARLTKATMRIHRKPGDLMEVDWAGDTFTITDQVTGDEYEAYLFVAVLACSGYCYAEAFVNQKTESWISAHVHAYSYFGGSTRILVPDNLRTGVIKNTRDELHLKRSYQELAEHYDTAIIPTRVSAPKDKPNAEGSVKHTSTWIIAALRNEKFFNINELNVAVADKLEQLNSKDFQKKEGSRLSAFLNEEKDFMKPLPASDYELAVWSSALIHNDYLISDGINKYTVPYDVIGNEISVRVTSTTVEAFFQGSRIASHRRVLKKQRDPISNPEHMPLNHRKYMSYNKDAFLDWASSVGTNAAIVTKMFLESVKIPEQGYKSCASLTNLADKYTAPRLESACKRALTFTPTPSIKTIRTILQSGQDKINQDIRSESPPEPGNAHAFLRGSDYFKGGVQHD